MKKPKFYRNAAGTRFSLVRTDDTTIMRWQVNEWHPGDEKSTTFYLNGIHALSAFLIDKDPE